MGKSTKIEYTCDRCGKIIIDGKPYSIGRFRFMHIFKWWIPQPVNGYKMRYICYDCFASFKRWYHDGGESE